MSEREAKALLAAQKCLPGKQINHLVRVEHRRTKNRKVFDFIMETITDYNANVQRVLAITNDEVIVLHDVGFIKSEFRVRSTHPITTLGPLHESESGNPWFRLGEHEFEAYPQSIEPMRAVFPTTAEVQPTAEQNWPQRYDDRSLSRF